MKKEDKYHMLCNKSIQEIAFEELTEYLFCLILRRFKLNKEDIITKCNYSQIEFSINNEKLMIRLVRSTCLNRLEFYLKNSIPIIISVGYTLKDGHLMPLDYIKPLLKVNNEPCFPILMIAGKTYIDSETKSPYINKKKIDLPTSPLLAELIISILPSFEWIDKKFVCK